MDSGRRSYLDYNASAPLLQNAREAMLGALELTGNASSVHFEGRALRKVIEEARLQVAGLISTKPSQIVFTSGATEAANFALSPRLRAGGREITVSRLYVSAIEHPCVLGGGRFATDAVEYLRVLESGIIDLEHVRERLTAHDPEQGAAMIAVMMANNETGIVQPIREIAEIADEFGAFLVVDAVQALGKLAVDVATSGAHFVIVSSHKIGGPQGAGALILRDASITPVPLMRGGGQENFLRGGTENVAAIAGFGAACAWQAKNAELMADVGSLRDSMEAKLKQISLDAGNDVAQPEIFGENMPRLANTSAFAVRGIKAETALIALDLDGVSVSSGSACSSGKVKQSHVLAAMNVPDDLADCALRVSLGWDTKPGDTDHFLSVWKKIVANRL